MCAEQNFHYDPESAYAVLEDTPNITLLPYEVCDRHKLTGVSKQDHHKLTGVNEQKDRHKHTGVSKQDHHILTGDSKGDCHILTGLSRQEEITQALLFRCLQAEANNSKNKQYIILR